MKVRSRILFISFVLLIGMSFVGCGCGQPHEEVTDTKTETSLKVVTTIPPLYSLTAHLSEGSDVELTNLVPANTSVHSFQLTPASAKSLAEADVVVINGLELEEFLEDAFENSNALIVDTSKGVKAMKMEGHEDEHHEEDHHDEDEHHDEEAEDHHHHGEFDPHIWLSTKTAKVQAKNIAEALEEKDPENADLYKSNLKKLHAELDELHEEIEDGINGLEVSPYIVFHDAYNYFEAEFGVGAVAAFETFPGKEPSAAYLKELIEVIEKNSVTVAFAEPQFSPKLLKTVASDYNLKVGDLDPLGQNVTKDTYFDIMRSNLAAFKKVFPSKN